ncbi:hypothetical protein [Marinomonas aquiplantarum]|uniref:Uncharacterized protein n=1 Tax=Marinomonas aquiplantarum TaxID=491951 RepID=A0A366CUA4_9GAMM|nr:hypothetical protein [Marinomonas aquiplantarum]RBO79648.1 hypothetical protein DFP76_11238 [Marinomonas aquiplantarum]
MMLMSTLKYLKSFTATCLVVISPIGFTGTAENTNAFVQSISDVRASSASNNRNDRKKQDDELPSLLWQQTFNSVGRQLESQGFPRNLEQQIALTKIEEAYQDEVDRLLDWQDEQIITLAQDEHAIAALRAHVQCELLACKQVKQAKLEQVKRLYLHKI